MGYKTSNIYRSPIYVPAHVTERKQNYHHCSWCSPRTAIEPFFTPPAPSLMRLIALKDMSGTTFVNATGRQQWTLSSCQLMRAQIDVCILVQKSKQKKTWMNPQSKGHRVYALGKPLCFKQKSDCTLKFSISAPYKTFTDRQKTERQNRKKTCPFFFQTNKLTKMKYWRPREPEILKSL